MKTTIVYGPMGCGKTTHSKDIARRLRCDHVVEGDERFDLERWMKLHSRYRHILVLCIEPESLPAFQTFSAALIPFSFFQIQHRGIIYMAPPHRGSGEAW